MSQLDIFNRRYIDCTPASGVVKPSDINYLRRLYTFNRDSIENYYQTRNFSVKNTNIISRLVGHFPSYLNYDSYRYLEFANDRTKYLAKHYKFTSDIEKGIVHPSYFFGNEGEEIIISGYDTFDINSTVTNWKTAKCISTLKHPRNDIRLLLPLGNDDGSASGIDAVQINIPMLSIKYREFVREQTVNSGNGGIVLSKNNFVIKYILPTMMEDIIDHVFLNKIMDRFYGIEGQTPKFRHRFKLFDPTTQIDRYIDQTLDVITTKRLDFINILHNIQLIFKIDASELLALSDFGYTRQIRWAILASRIDHMLFIYDVAKNKDMNRHYLNDWARLAKRLERDGGLEFGFSSVMSNELKEKIYRVAQM